MKSEAPDIRYLENFSHTFNGFDWNTMCEDTFGSDQELRKEAYECI